MIFAAPTEDALFAFYTEVSDAVCNKLIHYTIEERYARIVGALKKFEALAEDIRDGLEPAPKPKEPS